MLEPKAALHNFARLEQAGARGAYGFYEALDYTPSNLPENGRVAVVRSYMAHHQGMTLVALGNVVHDGLTREALSRPSHGPGRGAAASGADAAFGGRDPAPGRGGAGSTAGPRSRSPDAAKVRVAARHHAAHPSSLQRPLHRHDHGGGLRLQPLERSRRHPLARGFDARRLGHVRLPAGCRHRRRLVRWLPAERNGGRPLRGRLLRGPRQDHPARPIPLDHPRDRGLPRRRCRASPADGDQCREPGP